MKKLMLRTLVAVLIVQVLFFGSTSVVSAEEMTCPEHSRVDIDIKPGSYPNTINLSSQGVVAVAVLTTQGAQGFNASQFMPIMAHLSDASMAMTMGCVGADAIRWKLDDVDGDGQLDLVFFFRIQELN